MHTTPAPLLYLSRAEVEALAPDAAAIADALEALLRAARAGAAWNAPKTAVWPGDGRLFQAMVAVADEPPRACVKSVGLAPGNAARGLPHIGAVLAVFDSRSGLPLALLDGNAVTATRTAAITLVAARRLARPDSRVLALAGAGVQARSHVEALAGAFPLDTLRVLGRGPAAIEALLAHARARGLAAEAVDDPRALLDGADLVVSSIPAAPGLAPFLDAALLAPGAFASLVDLGRSWLPDSLATADRVLVDDAVQETEAAAHGRQMIEPALVGGDLDGLLAGVVPARRTREERTVFAFRGIALADLAAANLVLEAAAARATGTVLPR